ncbi:hypothetical protein CRM22_000884 [Opisthorchis felineus]|uniref:Uncharacterized protein n=1 Tax=Opisthorchis felineus TaxID=147828 RepID=A0A4S2MJ94_OPIFE|nr:hypothetical protein CRM22_000884 [Opisthorchis felineus]
MSLQERLENVNEGNIFVCFCLFWWLLLVGAQSDHLISLPYWALFFPLWLWKVTVFFGWLTGLVVWLRQRHTSVNPEFIPTYEDPALPYIQAMSVSTFLTLLLSCSEILLCLHLSLPSLQLAYLTIFTPLLLVGLLGIFGFFFVMIDSRSMFSWARRRRARHRFQARSVIGQETFDEFDPAFMPSRPRRVCSFTLELCIAANLLQLLFLISRLDNWIRSKWIVTFIPSFILLGMGFIFCTIGFIFALIRYFTAFNIPPTQRRLPVYYYASHIFINFLLCTAVAFLALRLDNYLSAAQISYSLICAPVLLSLIIYSVNSFCLGPGNPWWFGLNRNVLLAVFEASPALQLCANTSVTPAGLWKSTANGHHVSNGVISRQPESLNPGDVISDANSQFYSQFPSIHLQVSSANSCGETQTSVPGTSERSDFSAPPSTLVSPTSPSKPTVHNAAHEDTVQPLLPDKQSTSVSPETNRQLESVRNPD